jgi:hypothetical protein
MNGGFELHGIVGAFILMGTIVVMALIALISLIVHLAFRKSGQSGLKWSKYFLLSALIFLLFDGMILLFLYARNETVLNREQAIAFDKWMLFGWIPAHLFGYFLVAVLIRSFSLPERANQ